MKPRNRSVAWVVVAALLSCGIVGASDPVAGNPVSVHDGCGDAGPGGTDQDIRGLSAVFDAATERIIVRMPLCGRVADGSMYQVHFDYREPFLERDTECATTSEQELTYRPGRLKPVSGPGTVRVEYDDAAAATLVFETDASALGLLAGDVVRVWSRAKLRNVSDRAPDTDGSDDCTEPQGADEALFLSLSPVQQTLVDCTSVPPFGGDLVFRGFYVEAFPGASLDRVDLWFTTYVPGTYTLSLTARANTYDGPLVGESTATVDLIGPPGTGTPTSFAFPSPAVTEGAVVTFSIAVVAGPSESVYYAANCGEDAVCAASCPVIQTNGTTPPLDSRRRNGVNVRIVGRP